MPAVSAHMLVKAPFIPGPIHKTQVTTPWGRQGLEAWKSKVGGNFARCTSFLHNFVLLHLLLIQNIF